MIFGDYIGRWGRAFPDKEALVDAINGRRYSYGELAEDVHRMANFLKFELGVGFGDRVASLSYNRVEVITLFFALGRLGGILVPLNFRLAEDEFLYYFEDAVPKALFFDRDHQDVVRALKPKLAVSHYVCYDDDSAAGGSLPVKWTQLSTDPPPDAPIREGDPHLMIYTSGTTGLPKGVILTHGMMMWNAMNTILGWDMRSEDSTILHAGMFYTAGWNVFTLPIFLSRGVNILVKSFDPDLILDLIQNEGVTLFFGVPTMYRMLIDSPKFDAVDFSRVRFMVSGGAPLGRDLFEIFKTRKSIHLWEGYGLTEVGPNNFLANGKPGTVGHPMPFVDVKLIDAQSGEVPTGSDGELLIRGPHVCAGYWNKPKATSESIVDGWFHTGDLAKIDEDGHLSIVGRLKDMIISGGANIYPAEIERIIETHPSVAGAAVIGVPDAKWGEVGKAVVELKPQSRLTLEELAEFLKSRMGKYKIPKYLAVVDRLPRTPVSGKVQKFILKEQHGGADHQ
ncbi:MAG: long-chain fatty acid--CoA ligase [Deltaproteobacteria bacterium]|nr:long-chain fatty acid--CoA ligase [Deltaproteobacteria bacterium]